MVLPLSHPRRCLSALAVLLLLLLLPAAPVRAALLRDGVDAFNHWPSDPKLSRLSSVPVVGQAFATALKAEVFVKPANPWDNQLNSPTLAPVEKDDVISGELWFRNADPNRAEAVLDIVFEQAGEPYVQSLVRTVRESRGVWTRARFAFASRERYPTGTAQANLRLGGAVQTVEIGPFAMTNHARARSLSEFPNDLLASDAIGGRGGLVPELDAFNPQLPDASHATLSVISVAGQPFTRGLRIRTLRVPPNAWNLQLHTLVSQPVGKGDILAGEIWLRQAALGAASGAVVELVFERAGDPFTKSLERLLGESAGQWQRFRFAFASAEAYAAGQAQLNLRLGYQIQTIDLAGLVLTNHGRSRPLADFPNDVTYPEREPAAPWRAEAESRIEQHRKANLTVEVRDALGNPVPGALVSARQTRHAFPFGSAVPADLLLASGAPANAFRRVVTNWFTRAVLENDLKWPVWEANRAQALAGVRWLRQHGLDVRGHTLIWPSTKYLPADVPALLAQPEALRRRIRDHFTDVLGSLAGQCVDWDVVNEPYTEHDVMDVLGTGEMKTWFEHARALDPAARLYLNDYNNVDAFPGSPHAEGFFEIARSLLQQGAPLDGLGFQCHLAGYLPPLSQVYRSIDRFAALVPEVSITELDVTCPDPATQADYLRDVTTVAFSHPKTRAILLWGFWEGRMWNSSAALFRTNWTLKPNGIAWSNLVFRTWWTTTNLATDASGRALVRGFKGNYEIDVTTPSGTRRHETRLDSDVLLASGTPENPAPPRLGWRLDAEGPSLSWPGDRTGFQVQFCPTLPATAWQTLSLTPRREGAVWRAPLPAQPGFYRLVR